MLKVIMNRPSGKLLKDMSSEELSIESEWHLGEAGRLFEEVHEMRTSVLELSEEASNELLQSAAAKEIEAEAHVHQSNLLDTLRASRLSEHGVGDAHRTAKA